MKERICHFVPQSEIKEVVEREFGEIKKELQKMFPEADIQHVGSSAVEGALTKKDLDITVRVSAENFPESIEKMRTKFLAVHENVWVVNEDEGMAIFKVRNIPKELESIDIMLVVKDSRFDEYVILRDILKKDPCLLKNYNDLKSEHQGKPYKEYRKNKSELWGGHG